MIKRVVTPPLNLIFKKHFVSLTAVAADGSHAEEVSFIDPRSIARCNADGIDCVKLVVSKSFLALFRSGGQHELGDGDDPMNSWIFGKRGEVFQLRFIGSFPCRSGYVCAFAGSFERASQVEWSTLKQQIDAGLPLPPPILWAGRILESSTASVYAKLDPQECVEGITITS